MAEIGSKNLGITIRLRSDWTQLKDDMNSMNKVIATSRKLVTALNKDLKFDPTNTKYLGEKFEAIKLQIDATREKVRLYRNELDTMARNSDGQIKDTKHWQDLQTAIVNCEAEIRKMERQLEELKVENIRKLGEEFENAGSSVEKLGKSLAKVSAVSVGAFAVAGKSAMDFESAFIGVQKTVDETETTKFEDIEKTIRKMATELPSSATEIAGIMEMAGQLGVSADDLEKFTRVIVDLGNATNIVGEDGAKTLAQLYNVMHGNLDTIDRFGAALTALGNNSATTEADILNMAKGLAAMASQIGLSEQDLLGLATTLASTGLAAERGGSAISTIFRKVAKDVTDYSDEASKRIGTWAELAGVSSAEFRKLWGEDTIGMIKRMIGGLSQVEDKGGNIYKVLDELDVANIRQIDSVTRLSQAYENFDRYLDMANDEWDKNSALVIEAGRRYGSTESQIQILKNTLNEIAITFGQDLLPVVVDFVKKAKPIVMSIRDWVKQNSALVKGLLSFGAVISPTTLFIGKFMSTVGKGLKVYADWKKATLNMGSAMGGLAKAIGVAGGLGVAGAVVGLTAAIGAGIYAYVKANDEIGKFKKNCEETKQKLNELSLTAQAQYNEQAASIDNAEKYTEKIDRLVKLLNEQNLSEEEQTRIKSVLKENIDEVNKALGIEAVAFDEETGKITVQGEAVDTLSGAYDNLRDSMKKQAWLDANYDTYTQSLKDRAEALQTQAGYLEQAADKAGELQTQMGLTDQQTKTLIDYLTGNASAETLLDSLATTFTGLNEQGLPLANEKFQDIMRDTETIRANLETNNELIQTASDIMTTYEGVVSGTITDYDNLILGQEKLVETEGLSLETLKQRRDLLWQENEANKQKYNTEKGGLEEIIAKYDEEIAKEEEKHNKRTELADEYRQQSFADADEIAAYEKQKSDETREYMHHNAVNVKDYFEGQVKEASDYIDKELGKERVIPARVEILNPGALNEGRIRNNYKDYYGSGGFNSGGFASGGHSVTINNTFSVNALSQQNALMFSRTIIDQVDAELGGRLR